MRIEGATQEELLWMLEGAPIDTDALKKAAAQAPPGLVLEFGVYKGDSLREISSFFPDRLVYGFDSFEGLPETWWPGHAEKGEYRTEPPEVDERQILVKGRFEETLVPFLRQHRTPVAFVHVDCDLYDSAIFVLRALRDSLAIGAIVVFDEVVGMEVCHRHEGRALFEFLTDSEWSWGFLPRNDRCQGIIRLWGLSI